MRAACVRACGQGSILGLAATHPIILSGRWQAVASISAVVMMCVIEAKQLKTGQCTSVTAPAAIRKMVGAVGAVGAAVRT